MALGLDVIAMIGFFAIVAVLLIIDRKSIEFNYGIIIRRWKRGQEVMDKWISSHKKSLTTLGTVGVVIGFAMSIFGLGGLIYASTFLNQQGAALVLPTVGEFQYPTTAVIGVPFWFWLISIFVVLTVHEPMHAIFSRLAGVPVKSWGVMTLLVVPIGAFVDPDMRRVQKLKFMQKLRIFAGGSLGNFIAAAFFVLLWILLAFVVGNYMSGQSTIPGTPAAEAGVYGDLISVNGIEIKESGDLTLVLNGTAPGTKVDVATEEGTFSVVTAPDPRGGAGSYLGLSFGLLPEYRYLYDAITTLINLFRWLILFNFGIGIFNLLPMKPFDGGHMFEAVFQRIFKNEKKARKAITITSLIVLAIVLYSIFGTNLVSALT